MQFQNAISALPKTTLALVFMFILVVPAAAWDYTELTVIDAVDVDGNPAVTIGQGFSVRVRTMNDGGTVDTSVNALIFELYTTHNATLPPTKYIVNGEVQFDNVVFNAPGTGIQLEGRAIDDPTAPKGYEWINCYPHVDHFNVTIPAGEKWVGQDIIVELIAVDGSGMAIGNFADDVILSAAVGDLAAGPTQLVSGSAFDHGSTMVPVRFLGTHILTRTNTLHVSGTVIYPGQPDYATGLAQVTPLWPGGLDGIVLVLPGENLTPGVPPGKSGAPDHQLTGINFDVTVYAVDPYWNPVLVDDPLLPVTIDFSTSDTAGGVQLPGTTVLATNILPDQSVKLITSALHSVSAEASGNINDIDDSFVNILSQGLNHFEFNYTLWDTTDIQVTTQPFNVRITARDFFDNIYPYNGTVSLRVKYGADESEDYIIASDNTFVDGQLSTDIQVTRRFFSCALICDSGGSASSTSANFQVNAGPLASFLITLPGQTYAPGLNTPGYSGNLGIPNPVVAGTVVSPATVRPVDEFFNLVGGSHFVGATSVDGYFVIEDHSDNNFTVSNATDIDVVFRTFGNRTLQVTSSSSVSGTSSALQVSPAAMEQLAVVAPGEVLVPGIFKSIEVDGKTGDPDLQDAGVPFQVTVVATDSMWNPVNDSDPALPLNLDFNSTDPLADLPLAGQAQPTPEGNYSIALRTLADPNFQTVEVINTLGGQDAFTSVPLQAGVIDHLTLGINSRTNPSPNDALDPVPDIVAGQILNDLTIIARDQFDNHIPNFTGTATLSVSHGSDIITPFTVDFADGGNWPGAENGVWRGGIQIFAIGEDVVLTVTDDNYLQTGDSTPFDILPGSYSELLILSPGEIHTPGIGSGKAGTPLPITAGETLIVSLMAVDQYFNTVPAQPTVFLSSSGYSEVTSTNPVTISPEGLIQAELFFRTAGEQLLQVADVTQPARSDTSVIEVEPGEFTRLQIIAPGEIPNPGGYEADGKLGSPDLQTTSLQFPITVNSVDPFWNLVPNNDEHIHVSSTDGALGDGNPVNLGQNLSGGTIVFPLFLIANGSVVVEATPLDDLGILPQSVTINLLQGSQYIIDVPDSAYVGPPQTFAMTVNLVDSLGIPESAANNTVQLTAFKSNLDPASSALWVGQATLNEGTVVIPAQAYDTVEDIIIRVSDDAGRQAFTQSIHMLSNGLAYHVSIADSSGTVAGPPSTFAVEVELRDTDTGTRVDQDRDLDIEVWSAASTAIGLGMTGITEASLESGYCLFNQSYSKAENVYIHIEDDLALSGNSPIFTITSDGYKRLQLLVPGEEVRPGEEIYFSSGKAGTPDTQRSRIDFPVTVRAVDQFWNLSNTTVSGAIHFSATDNSVDEFNPDQMDLPFVNGSRTFQLYLESEGQVDLSVWDAANPDPPGQTVSIPVNPGYEYRILTEDDPHTGYPGFQMTVEMIDPVTDEPAPDANHSFTIAALNPDFSVATGVLAITEETLAAGQRVINNQQYDRVEPIIIRVMDDVDRVGYTGILDMQPGGLVYEVIAPDSATVGGPASFPVQVRLLDLATDLVVASQDTTFTVEVFSGVTGLLGEGEWSVGAAVLSDGTTAFNQTYTAAGNIYLRVSDERGITGISNTIFMNPDGYKRLQIVSPGETPVPGVISSTGKTGEPLLQQAEVPFMLQVRATDQYWNLINTFEAGEVTLSSSEGSIGEGNPTNQGAPLVGGVGDYSVTIHNQGSIIVFCEDLAQPEILAHSVNIPVDQAQYEILVPAIAQAGPPSYFPITVRLVKDDGSLITVANNEVYLQALAPNHEAARNTLGIMGGILAAGELSLPEQTYSVVEDIIIRVTDDLGRESFSPVIHMVPEGVTYEISTPAVATVGPPESFNLELSLIDTSTGQLVTSDDRSLTIRAINHGTGEDGAGVLALTSGTTDGGILTMAQSYTAAETIYLAIEDDQGVVVYSNPIQIGHGPPQNIAIESTHDLLEVGQAATITATLSDLFGNQVINEPVEFLLVEGDGVLTADSILTGNMGTASNVVAVPEGGRRDLSISVRVADLPDRLIEIEVIGPPLTTLQLDGTNVATSHGLMITPETSFELSSSSEIGLFRIYWGLDLGPEAVPDNIFDGAITFADLGLTDYGAHTISFYADDIRGHEENIQTFTVMLGSNLADNKQLTNRPNPFRAGGEETVIIFRARETGTSFLKIYDLYGNLVWRHEIETPATGIYQIPWDGRNGHGEVVGNGGYILVVQNGGAMFKRKIAVVK